MKLGIMQPYFFPYIGYFQSIAATDTYVFYDRLNYVKKSWTIRNCIDGRSNAPFVYIRPTVSKPNHSEFPIYQVLLDQGGQWRKKLLKSLSNTYRRAAHFDEIQPVMEELIEYRPEKLSEFNVHAIQRICELLGISTKLIFNDPVLIQVEEELKDLVVRYQREVPSIDRKQVRVIEFCKRKQAQVYLNSIGGTHIYSGEIFQRLQIELIFIESGPVVYRQFDRESFTPNLSIIDVLMHNGLEGTRAFLNSYRKVAPAQHSSLSA